MDRPTPDDILTLLHGAAPDPELPTMERKAARLFCNVFRATRAEVTALLELAPMDPRLREPLEPGAGPVLPPDAARITTAEQLYHAATFLLHEIRMRPEETRQQLAEEIAQPQPMEPAEALLLHRRLAQVAEQLLADRARGARRSVARRWGGPRGRARFRRAPGVP